MTIYGNEQFNLRVLQYHFSYYETTVKQYQVYSDVEGTLNFPSGHMTIECILLFAGIVHLLNVHFPL